MTECTHTQWLTNTEYLNRFYRKAAQLRTPLSGSIDLTHRCNLKCIHCYVGPQDDVREKQNEEMPTSKVFSLIDEIAEAGCLELLISGGDPLVRRDFSDIFLHAKMKGLLVTVFTNGTLVTEEVLSLFHRYPPYLVEISLYGATSCTYESITGIPGSYARCIHGIERLLSRGIRVKLKTVLMTMNSHELHMMEQVARAYGISFRIDAALFPRLNGDRSPLLLRVPAEDAVAKELGNEERLENWKEFYGQEDDSPLSNQLYVCGAGKTGFDIDPYGILRPCVMVRNITFDLSKGSFLSGWTGPIKEITRKQTSPTYACSGCEDYVLCAACPGFFDLENGAEELHSEYLCAMGRARKRVLSLHAQGAG
ncbi:MAG TPA: radical SAM/SPASM domain-containing protein [Thermodesulfovibrionales bacterium]|nr:radical SAM/SPASM domain-containing protein [Thermodesulfovibrionales bacterium]